MGRRRRATKTHDSKGASWIAFRPPGRKLSQWVP